MPSSDHSLHTKSRLSRLFEMVRRYDEAVHYDPTTALERRVIRLEKKLDALQSDARGAGKGSGR